MKKSLKFLTSLLFLASLANCASYEVPDFKAHITLPASEDGYGISVLTQKRVRYPKAEWAELRKRGIILLPEDYKILKKSILKNCNLRQCTQLTGALDNVFKSIDEALKTAGGKH